MKKVAGLLALAWGAAAGVSGSELLVSPEWLAAHRSDPRVVILHVGTQKDYDAGHVPGARLVSLADISVTGERGLRLELPPVERLAAALGRLGIAGDSRIIVYPAGESVQSATRVWFTLVWAGLGANTSLLDGGLAGWRGAGNRLTSEAPLVEPVELSLTAHPELVVDSAWVSEYGKDPNMALIDARAPEFYTGADRGMMPRAGHIPGARNLPFSSVLDAQYRLKPAVELRRLFAERGAVPGKLLAVYCHIGQQATLVYFAARTIGLEPRLYDGSFQDWSMRAGLPVETGTGRPLP